MYNVHVRAQVCAYLLFVLACISTGYIYMQLEKCEFLGGLKLTQEEKVRFLLQSAFKVNRNNVKMLKGV